MAVHIQPRSAVDASYAILLQEHGSAGASAARCAAQHNMLFVFDLADALWQFVEGYVDAACHMAAGKLARGSYVYYRCASVAQCFYCCIHCFDLLQYNANLANAFMPVGDNSYIRLQQLYGIAAQAHDMFLGHGIEQAANDLATGMQLIGYLLVGDEQGRCITSFCALPQVVQQLLVHLAEGHQVYHFYQFGKALAVGAVNEHLPFRVAEPFVYHAHGYQQHFGIVFGYGFYHAALTGLAAVDGHSAALPGVQVIQEHFLAFIVLAHYAQHALLHYGHKYYLCSRRHQHIIFIDGFGARVAADLVC